jgi:hypothetical protein
LSERELASRLGFATTRPIPLGERHGQFGSVGSLLVIGVVIAMSSKSRAALVATRQT